MFYCLTKAFFNPNEVTTFAGSSSGYANGFGTNVQFSGLMSAAITPNLRYALISEFTGRIRLTDRRTSETTLVAGGGADSITKGYADGQGTNALFSGGTVVDISPDGTFALASEFGVNHHHIRKIDLKQILLQL